MNEKLKPLSLPKLRKDLQTIMDEIDRSHGVIADNYSPVMWQRLQNTAEKVANAIECVRMRLSSPEMNAEQIGKHLGLSKMQVAAYMAWNTMYGSTWIKPSIVIRTLACPKCGMAIGIPCEGGKMHEERRSKFKNSHTAGIKCN
jgi:DNA-binding CsgD family transcriptional regulator